MDYEAIQGIINQYWPMAVCTTVAVTLVGFGAYSSLKALAHISKEREERLQKLNTDRINKEKENIEQWMRKTNSYMDIHDSINRGEYTEAKIEILKLLYEEKYSAFNSIHDTTDDFIKFNAKYLTPVDAGVQEGIKSLEEIAEMVKSQISKIDTYIC
ncbi:MAG: hypothetical protein ACP5N3_06485 [Candidatus Nanoarchaeia archaeon]